MSNDETKRKKDPKKLLSNTYVSFIDVLFAVVIGQSFVLLTAPDYYSQWFVKPYDNAFGLFTLLLVYGLVITSWVGYHQSVSRYPLQSVWRFLIDIILLFLYYFAFANAKDFGAVLLAITISFFAYVIWDSFRMYENRSNLSNVLWTRFAISILFFGCYVVVYFSYLYATLLVQGIGWLFLVIAVVLLVAYRIKKWYRNSVGLPKENVKAQ